MKRLYSLVMSIFLFVFITFNLSTPQALAQTVSNFSNLEEEPTLQSIDNRLQNIESMLVITQGDQPEPDELTEPPESESGLVPEVVNVSRANQLEATIDSWGLPNFRGSEVTRLLFNRCNGRQNSVPPTIYWENIGATFAVLQKLRTDLGKPMTLTSVYRDPIYNKCVGGATNSFHTDRGRNNKSMTAIDFSTASTSPRTVTRKLRSYRGRTFTNPANGRSFVFAGGIGTYFGFNHLDTGGFNGNFGDDNF